MFTGLHLPSPHVAGEVQQREEQRVRLKLLQFEQIKGMILTFHPYDTKFEARRTLR